MCLATVVLLKLPLRVLDSNSSVQRVWGLDRKWRAGVSPDVLDRNNPGPLALLNSNAHYGENMKRPQVGILADEDVHKIVVGCLKSNNWWLFIGVLGHLDLQIKVEEQYYRGNANDDFIVFVVPPAQIHSMVVGLALAHKKHMTSKQLAKICKSMGSLATSEELKTHDVVLPIYEKEIGNFRDIGPAVHYWLLLPSGKDANNSVEM